MHKQHGKGDFRAVGLNLDDPEDADFRAESLKFLKKVNAAFQHFQLNEKSEDWQKHFGISILPCVLVIGKDGKLAKRFDSEGANKVDYAEIEKLVKQLLEAK